MLQAQLFTLADVARLLCVSKTKLYYERKSGRLRTVHFGRVVRVRPSDLKKYIDAARSCTDGGLQR